MSQICVTYSLFCNCGMWVGYCLSRKEAYARAIKDGWKRKRGRGWTCTVCLEALTPSAV